MIRTTPRIIVDASRYRSCFERAYWSSFESSEYRRVPEKSERIFGGPEYLHSVVLGGEFGADQSAMLGMRQRLRHASGGTVVVACAVRVRFKMFGSRRISPV